MRCDCCSVAFSPIRLQQQVVMYSHHLVVRASLNVYTVLTVPCETFWAVRCSGPQFRCFQHRGRGTTLQTLVLRVSPCCTGWHWFWLLAGPRHPCRYVRQKQDKGKRVATEESVSLGCIQEGWKEAVVARGQTAARYITEEGHDQSKQHDSFRVETLGSQ